MKETRHYSGLLYALADTLSDAAQAEEVREAASRLDLQTVGLNEFRRQKEQAEKERDDWIDSHAKLHRKSSDRIAELERALEACRSDLEAATEACEELDGDLRAANPAASEAITKLLADLEEASLWREHQCASHRQKGGE